MLLIPVNTKNDLLCFSRGISVEGVATVAVFSSIKLL